MFQQSTDVWLTNPRYFEDYLEGRYKMYILFEKANANGDDSIHNYDAMGCVSTEQEAMKWRDENPEYRVYKYCRVATTGEVVNL